MTTIVSTYFRMIAFPHKGTITVINQLSLFASILQVTGIFPYIHLPQLEIQNIGVWILKDSTLMGPVESQQDDELSEKSRLH